MSRRSGAARIAVLLAILAIGAAATPGLGAAQPVDPISFAVFQDGDCVTVSTLGDGTESVESFYDYRSHGAEYSSHGTTHLQESGTSQLFFFLGSEGVSLVFLHDAMGDGAGGGTITMTVSGLPEDREWAVEDDDYGPNTDDDFSHSSTRSRIEWVWGPNRSDGAAVRGLGSLEGRITVDPAFDEGSARWDEWEHTGDDHRVDRWIVRSGSGETRELNRSDPVRIDAGECPSEELTGEAGISTGTESGTTSELGAQGASTATPSPTPSPAPAETASDAPATASDAPDRTPPSATETAGETPRGTTGAGTAAAPMELPVGPEIGMALGTLLVLGSAALRGRA